MTDHEHIERELHDAVGEIRGGTGISSNIRRRIRMRRVGTVATGLVVASALAFGATFAAGAFSTGERKVGPADDSPSSESSQTLYAIFDDERVDLRFETEIEIDAICSFGRHFFADEAVEKAEIVEGKEARTPVLVFEPNPNHINMTVEAEEDDDDSIGWCFEGLNRDAMNAVLASPEDHFLVLGYRNGDEAISALLRDNEDGNYATGPDVTIAEGNFLGADWEYYGYESNDGLCLELEIGNNSGGGCGFRLRKTSEVLNINGTSFGASPDGTGIAAVEGQVADAVDRLEIEISDDPAESIDIVQPPEALGFKDRVFVHLIEANRLSGHPPVWLVAYDPDDQVLARERVNGLEDLAP